MGCQELPQPRGGRVFEEGVWAAFLFDLTLMEKHDAVRNLSGKAEFMRHNEHCPTFLGQRPDDLEDLAHQFGIER